MYKRGYLCHRCGKRYSEKNVSVITTISCKYRLCYKCLKTFHDDFMTKFGLTKKR